jgi:dTDP-4-dehydrorhamnose 3,5-epimerase
MQVVDTYIPDVKIIEPRDFVDERGFFMKTCRDDWFRQNVSVVNFIQDNHSKSKQGILRGLHYHLENTQGKLVRVTSGEFFDVAVNMRKSSSTFGQ